MLTTHFNLLRSAATLFTLLFSFALFAQDDIILIDNSVVRGKVTEVGVDVIKYIRADNPDGPTFDLPKSQINMIVYANGTSTVINGNGNGNYNNTPPATGNQDNLPAPTPPPVQTPPAQPAQYYSNDGITMQTFYDQLSPYGNWINDERYGYVWVPNVGPDFRPYASAGHWVFTEYGWTWASDFPWGWAAFHYGRWFFEPGIGYAWVPDLTWGPAWVDWRRTEGYYGWAPIGPRGYYYPHERWCFVGSAYIGDEHIYNHYERRENVEVIYNRTTVVENNYNAGGGVHYIAGPSRTEVEQVNHVTITPVHIVSSSTPGQAVHSNGQLTMYHPAVHEVAAGAAQPRPTQVVTKQQVTPVEQRVTVVHPVVQTNTEVHSTTITNVPQHQPTQQNNAQFHGEPQNNTQPQHNPAPGANPQPQPKTTPQQPASGPAQHTQPQQHTSTTTTKQKANQPKPKPQPHPTPQTGTEKH